MFEQGRKTGSLQCDCCALLNCTHPHTNGCHKLSEMVRAIPIFLPLSLCKHFVKHFAKTFSQKTLAFLRRFHSSSVFDREVSLPGNIWPCDRGSCNTRVWEIVFLYWISSDIAFWYPLYPCMMVGIKYDKKFLLSFDIYLFSFDYHLSTFLFDILWTLL